MGETDIEAALEKLCDRHADVCRVFESSPVLQKVAPARTEGFLTRFRASVAFFDESLAVFGEDLKVAAENGHNEKPEFDCTPLFVYDSVMTRLLHHWLRDQARFTAELTAILKSLAALKEFVTILATKKFTLFRHSEIEKEEKELWKVQRKNGTYHTKERIKDTKRQTNKLIEYVKKSEATQKSLRSKMEQTVQKYEDEMFYYYISIPYKELVERTQKRTGRTILRARRLELLPPHQRIEKPAPVPVVIESSGPLIVEQTAEGTSDRVTIDDDAAESQKSAEIESPEYSVSSDIASELSEVSDVELEKSSPETEPEASVVNSLVPYDLSEDSKQNSDAAESVESPESNDSQTAALEEPNIAKRERPEDAEELGEESPLKKQRISD